MQRDFRGAALAVPELWSSRLWGSSGAGVLDLQERSSRRPVPGVALLLREVAEALVQRFSVCAVRGEISGFTRASSGHCYFNLKDAEGGTAVLRCAMFRRAASLLAFLPSDGQSVELRGRLGVFEPRGELQLVVESMQRAGAGALFEQFLRTKARLDAEGLFDPARKRALPRHARTVGVVTSLGGAVLHDVVTTLGRRSPHVAIVVYPSAVQGAGAPASLCAAIELAGRRREVDLLILCRGGGSIEDLWAFNDEQVVRAIVASPLPVVSGVGHETDVTLADFAADLRAPTPTAAAELVAPPTRTCLDALMLQEARLARHLRTRLDTAAQRFDRLCDRLLRPGQRIGQQAQRLEHLAHRLDAALRRGLQVRGAALAQREVDLRRGWASRAARETQHLAHLGARVRALDPHQVLARGYAWLADAAERPVMSVRHLRNGERLTAVLVDGAVGVRVEGLLEGPAA